jgi:hypothetical protein
MAGARRSALAAAILANILGGVGLAACDGQQQRAGKAGDRPSQQAEAPGLDAAQAVVGTWRVRLADAPDRSKARVYTFTADGRVTVAPGQVCRYRIEDASWRSIATAPPARPHAAGSSAATAIPCSGGSMTGSSSSSAKPA